MDRPNSRDQSGGQDHGSQLPPARRRRTSTISLESGLPSDQRDQSRRVRQGEDSTTRPALPPPPEYVDQCNGRTTESDVEPSPVDSLHPMSMSSSSSRRPFSSAGYSVDWDDAERPVSRSDMVQSPMDMGPEESDTSNEPTQGVTHPFGASARSTMAHHRSASSGQDAHDAHDFSANTRAEERAGSPMDTDDDDQMPLDSESSVSRDGVTPTPEAARKNSSD